jgi:hypothetical protein
VVVLAVADGRFRRMGGSGGWEGEEDGRERRMGGRGGWEGEKEGRERRRGEKEGREGGEKGGKGESMRVIRLLLYGDFCRLYYFL